MFLAVCPKQAELVIPPAPKGSTQMTSEQVQATKRIANVRIYVERVIKKLKDFRIINQTIPIIILRQANDIVICVALINLRGRL